MIESTNCTVASVFQHTMVPLSLNVFYANFELPDCIDKCVWNPPPILAQERLLPWSSQWPLTHPSGLSFWGSCQDWTSLELEITAYLFGCTKTVPNHVAIFVLLPLTTIIKSTASVEEKLMNLEVPGLAVQVSLYQLLSRLVWWRM